MRTTFFSVPLAIVLSNIAIPPLLHAQIEPCYCIQKVHWNSDTERWEIVECTGSCALLEGACVPDSESIGGTLYVWCKCTNVADPFCYCAGKARNPNYDPNQLAPLIMCRQIAACAVSGATCNALHLSIPVSGSWPICLCN